MRLTLADPPKKLQTSDSKRRQELMEGSRALRTVDDNGSRVRYEDVEMNSSPFIENEMVHQSVLIEEQDEHLDSLYGTARNIHDIATIMGQEIEDQTTLLDEFGDQVDKVQGRLSRAMSKVAYIIKKNEGRVRDTM
ncbi:1144_t:CDS:2 [Paraglomus brasilianum]|uniref:t-SNARE affecting a late Golgi compartment protein 1 n=1 Tax=Paraglomus brasilianum TaxID=144538 RepID=A0A9N9BHN6_9GLOM|nr:1144_t:CDS:2 [Paraglomus brasilianum]